MPEPEPTWELVRATGMCIACDSRFRDELAARIQSPCAPSGWAYIELRHLPVEVEAALRQGAPEASDAVTAAVQAGTDRG
jgi:hypothetical protein